MQDWLSHDGTPHEGTTPHSGRWPWGSGENPRQHGSSVIDRFTRLRKKGLTKEQICEQMGIEATEIRDFKKLESIKGKSVQRERALYLKTEKKMSTKAISSKLGVPEATLRGWLDNWEKTNMSKFINVATAIRDEVLKRKYVDIGAGTEVRLKVSDEVLRAVKTLLVRDHGFNYYQLEVPMNGNRDRTRTVKVLCAPGITESELKANRDKVDTFYGYVASDDKTVMGIKPPVSIDSKRIYVAYNSPKDGVVEIRRGVPDLSLGRADYAQVRIAVDGSHYIKGMAMYMDDALAKKIPKGYDLIVNTNKKEGVPLKSEDSSAKQVLKPFEEDKIESALQGKRVINQENPFGSALKFPESLVLCQATYKDPKDGKEKQSPINIVNEQGDWNLWSKEIASQVLSKQPVALAKRQLDLTYANQRAELENLKSLTNPIVKENFLNKFADECDSKSVSLKAAGFPRQASKVILPFNEIKPHECVCPTLENGTKVVLIRYPHEGTFQIPELVVNNNHPKTMKILGKGTDAIGISPKTAPILSGADFDGDTVLVIPVNNKIKFNRIDPNTSQDLKELQTFDSKIYKVEGRTGDPEKDKALGLPARPTKEQRSMQMGIATNLITDMVVTGHPSNEEYARATKYAMVVIDSYKHDLDWKQAKKDFRIDELHEKYQGKRSGGASTIFSQAKKEVMYPHRKEVYKSMMTPEERARWEKGEKIYRNSGETTVQTNKKTGQREIVPRTVKVEMLKYETDPYKLTSGGSKERPGTMIEGVYAEHSAKMKALANEARMEARHVEIPPMNRSAAKTYEKEVSSLNDKYRKVMGNKPLERIADLVATETYKAQLDKIGRDNLDGEDKKKLKDRARKAARMRVSGDKYRLTFTDREWEAIQANAVSKDKASKLISAADNDEIRERSMPKKKSGLTESQKQRIRAYRAAGWPLTSIADALGVSTSTVSNIVNERM